MRKWQLYEVHKKRQNKERKTMSQCLLPAKTMRRLTHYYWFPVKLHDIVLGHHSSPCHIRIVLFLWCKKNPCPNPPMVPHFRTLPSTG